MQSMIFITMLSAVSSFDINLLDNITLPFAQPHKYIQHENIVCQRENDTMVYENDICNALTYRCEHNIKCNFTCQQNTCSYTCHGCIEKKNTIQMVNQEKETYWYLFYIVTASMVGYISFITWFTRQIEK